jgi:hypothetical protein
MKNKEILERDIRDAEKQITMLRHKIIDWEDELRELKDTEQEPLPTEDIVIPVDDFADTRDYIKRAIWATESLIELLKQSGSCWDLYVSQSPRLHDIIRDLQDRAKTMASPVPFYLDIPYKESSCIGYAEPTEDYPKKHLIALGDVVGVLSRLDSRVEFLVKDKEGLFGPTSDAQWIYRSEFGRDNKPDFVWFRPMESKDSVLGPMYRVIRYGRESYIENPNEQKT